MEHLFSERLSELIHNSNYTLDEIEAYVGKTNATISRYASGDIKNVKISTIVKLADFFKVSPAWLAGLSDDKYETIGLPKDKQYELNTVQRYGLNSIKLLDNYNKLNDIGKEKAFENIKDLTEIPKYTKEEPEQRLREA